MNYVTKSGSSQLRGTGWYTAKRDSWVANDYVRKRQGNPKPLYRVNISGYSVGGPVVIPGLVDSRKSGGKKFYFFGSQEFTDDARRPRPRRQTTRPPSSGSAIFHRRG